MADKNLTAVFTDQDTFDVKKRSDGTKIFRLDGSNPICVARGFETACTQSVTIATGLNTIYGFAVSPLCNSATHLRYGIPTGKVSSGNLVVERVKLTGVVAATAGSFSWIAIGTIT